MGRRGPAPTPTAILKLRGSPRATRRDRKDEPPGPPGRPDRPVWLDDQAREMWDHLVPLLEVMRVLTRIDGNALARYCRLWARWRKAESFIDSKGEMYPLKDNQGGVKCFVQWPQVGIANKLAQQLTRLEQEFGMTPAARARVHVEQRSQLPPSRKSRFFAQ